MWRFAGVLLALLIAAPVVTRAEGGTVYDFGDKAPVPGNKTWRDLLGQLFTDLRQEPRKDGRMGDFIHGKVDIRPIGKEPFEDECSVDPLEIEYIETATVEISGKMRVIVGVTTDGDACFGALALFDGTSASDAKLLDAVNIQQDQNYGFGSARESDFASPLGPDARLVVADSFHTTTSSSPDNDVLVLATADKLTLIGNVDAHSEFDCDHHRSLAEDPYIAVTPDFGPFDRITGYIKRVVETVGDDCRTPTRKPIVTITRIDWRWDDTKKAYRRAGP